MDIDCIATCWHSKDFLGVTIFPIFAKYSQILKTDKTLAIPLQNYFCFTALFWRFLELWGLFFPFLHASNNHCLKGWVNSYRVLCCPSMGQSILCFDNFGIHSVNSDNVFYFAYHIVCHPCFVLVWLEHHSCCVIKLYA